MGLPTFEAEASGPAHDHTFRARVMVDGEVLGTGEGRSRREAERLASAHALKALADAPSRKKSGAPAPAAPSAPWPIYAEVLAEAIEVALEFAEDEATLEDVQHDAAQFYRGLLAELGHGPA